MTIELPEPPLHAILESWDELKADHVGVGVWPQTYVEAKEVIAEHESISCTSDSDCPEGQHCVEGVCVPIPPPPGTKFVWIYEPAALLAWTVGGELHDGDAAIWYLFGHSDPDPSVERDIVVPFRLVGDGGRTFDFFGGNLQGQWSSLDNSQEGEWEAKAGTVVYEQDVTITDFRWEGGEPTTYSIHLVVVRLDTDPRP